MFVRPKRCFDGEVRVELGADEDSHLGAVQEPSHAAVQDGRTDGQDRFIVQGFFNIYLDHKCKGII